MIKTKADLKKYLYQDQLAQNIDPKKQKRPHILGNYIWKFEICLRKYEYYLNNHKKMLTALYRYRFTKLSLKFGFSINPNTFGPGLCIAHYGCVCVGKATIGKNCYIHQNVTIGVRDGEHGCAIIGDNVVIGAGACIIGKIRIADNVVIGANAVVTKDILEPGTTWGGVPAKKISNNSSLGKISKLLEDVFM